MDPNYQQPMMQGQPYQGNPYPQQGGYPGGGYPQGGQPMMMGQPGMMGPGMMQPGMAGPGMIMVQANPLNFMNGLDKLMSVPGVYIKQKLELLEVLTGCETENKYVVYPASETGEKLKHSMFKAKEKSNCLARVCLK